MSNNSSAAYAILVRAVDEALDVRDAAGVRLRDFHFDNDGFASKLQAILLKGVKDAQDADDA